MIQIGFCDDDPSVLDELHELLGSYRAEHNADIAPTAFQSPFELLASIEKGARFDILLLDVLMPGENGIEAYQLKPIWPESFFRLMDSVIAACSRESSVSLILRCKTGITRVELDKLEYCEVIRRSLLLHKTDGTVLEAAGSMDSLCESLAEHRNFLRIHRSYLVNLEHIQTIMPKTLVMSSRAELPIPRGRYNDIKDAYLEHAFQKEQVFLT